MELYGFVVGVRLGGVGIVLAAEEAEVGDGFQTKLAGLLMPPRKLEAEEVCAVDIVQIKRRASVGSFRGDFDVAELEVFNVASVYACGGQDRQTWRARDICRRSLAVGWTPCQRRRRLPDAGKRR